MNQALSKVMELLLFTGQSNGANATHKDRLRSLYILRGIFSAASSNYSFEKLFKWFYPTYLQQVLSFSLPRFTNLSGIFAQFEDETQRKVII